MSPHERPEMLAALAYPIVSTRFERAVDGDTYVMRFAWKRSWEKGATTEHVRLLGWRAREISEPAEPGGRVSGREAAAIATALLTAASSIQVEVRGIDQYGRVLGNVNVAGVMPLGPMLRERCAVIAGDTAGAHRP